MEFTATPTDILKVVEVARQIDANPLALAGRMIGLGQDEQRAGIPAWAWCAAVLGVGVFVGVRYADEIRDALRVRER